mmetsp:Transcript_103767/g.298635  ORF Transcript_103767/g.298635 Transcript_103767/m.298635 type:complete len:448 (-) Transcript_103767:1131-2474(-)
MYVCLKCTSEIGPSYHSSEGSAECDECLRYTYMKGGKCVDKPEGVKIDEVGTTLESMRLDQGYFRFSSKSTEVYPCHHYSNCKGGKIPANSTTSLCREGSSGPLCSICEKEYYMSEYYGCLECTSGNAWLGPIVCVVVLLVCGAVVFVYRKKLKALYERHQDRAKEYSHRATMSLVTMQILVILNTTHKSVGGKEMPSPYTDFLALTGFATLDVVSLVPFDCMYEKSFDHADALLLESLVPLFMLGLAMLYASARKLRSKAGKGRKVLSAWLSMIFLVLPVISRRVCQSFKCDTFNVDESTEVRYLTADSGIDCSSSRYDGMFMFACLMVLLYPFGCPLLLFLLLFKYRRNLNPAGKDEDDVIKERKEDAILAQDPVTSFSMLYRPRFWGFEIYNMIRRLLLTCAVLQCEDLAQACLNPTRSTRSTESYTQRTQHTQQITLPAPYIT